MEVTGAALVLLAGGRGERAGGSTPKQFAVDGRGRSIMARGAAAAMAALPWSQVIVVVPEGAFTQAAQALSACGISDVTMVTAGAGRLSSVREGLAAVDGRSASVVVVHDGTRPFTPPELFTEVVSAVQEGDVDAAWPAAHPVNTVFNLDDSPMRPLSLRELLFVSTPMAVRVDVATTVLGRHADPEASAISLLIEAGVRWATVPDSPLNFKVTTARDLRDALALMDREPWPQSDAP